MKVTKTKIGLLRYLRHWRPSSSRRYKRAGRSRWRSTRCPIREPVRRAMRPTRRLLLSIGPLEHFRPDGPSLECWPLMSRLHFPICHWGPGQRRSGPVSWLLPRLFRIRTTRTLRSLLSGTDLLFFFFRFKFISFLYIHSICYCIE